MKIADLIKTSRKTKGLTQMALAVKAGVSLPTIQNLEIGKGNPTLSLLEKIYKPLGCGIQTHRTEPDWSLLVQCGLPLGGSKTEPFKHPPSHEELAEHLNLALSSPKLDDRVEASLASMIWAIYEYYPSFYQYCLDGSKAQSLRKQYPLNGRILKLRRMSLEKLANIL